MNNTIIITGKTVEDAIIAAVEALSANSAEDIEYTVLEEGKKGLFGIGAAPAKIEASLKNKGAAIALGFIKQLVADMQLNVTVEHKSAPGAEKDTCLIEINGEDAGVLIGHHGDTLDALQYLANLASAQKNAKGECDKSRVTIDIEGYRAKREDTLRALARRMANKALRNKRSVMLEPMTAYERRIIHSEIQNIEGVSTNSIGSDNNRKIVIYLTDKKPKGIFEEDTVAKESTSAAEEVVAEDEIVENTAVIEQSATASDDCDEVVSIEQTAPADEIATSEDDFDDVK